MSLNSFLNHSSEVSDEYVYEFDKNLSLKEQVLVSIDNCHLLNVRKKYTNNLYFGASFSIYKHGKNPFISHSVFCKDRGYTEELVDTFEGFISLRGLEDLVTIPNRQVRNKNKYEYFKQPNPFAPITGRTFDIYYAFDEDNNYKQCTFKFHDGKAIWRGLYGASKSEYENYVKDFDVVILESEQPTDEQLKYFYEKAVVSFSNVITEVNTDYSKIKVFHR